MRPLLTRRVVLGLGVLGAGLTLLTLSLTWGSLGATPGGAGPDPGLVLTGREAAPAASALAVAALAGLFVLLLVGRGGRRVVGVLLVGLGAGIAVSTGGAAADLTYLTAAGRVGATSTSPLPGQLVVDVTPAWAWAAAAGGVLVAVSGVLAVVGSPGWPAPSRRYGAPRPQPADDPWRALDQGVDPTVDD